MGAQVAISAGLAVLRQNIVEAEVDAFFFFFFIVFPSNLFVLYVALLAFQCPFSV